MNNKIPDNYKEVALVMLRHAGVRVSFVFLLSGLIFKACGDVRALDFVIVGVMICLRGFLEWGLHKYVWHSHPLPILHKRIITPVVAMHQRHHDDPSDLNGLIFGGVSVALFCLALLFGVWLLFGSFDVSVSVVIGFIVVLLIHEWFHVLAHSGIDNVLPIFHGAVHCHRVHHGVDARICMGLSSNVADKVFRTCGIGRQSVSNRSQNNPECS